MNIFVLDHRPLFAAHYHNDRHVVKMILETAQLLCTAHHFLDGAAAEKRIGELVLRPTHVNHPCAIWTRHCHKNYQWLQALGMSLLVEYRARYGKTHAYSELMDKLDLLPLNIQKTNLMTEWPQCMPDHYKRSSTIEAYRLYYYHEKKHLAKWSSPASVPEWWEKLDQGVMS